ncbi:MAG TPA: LacI family DNA-binding transcriptional regulator [Abditibacterium sp.]|jgi:DNA-binding LacI/PurR family transcriptional regulator
MSQLLQRPDKRATIQDIARLTGVSVATVSGAFSGKRRMSDQTRETVLTTARELGFEPNPHAQRLRNGGCANTIGLLSDLDLGVATLMQSAICRRLSERGFQVDDHVLPLYIQELETRQTEVLRQVCRQNPQAILFSKIGLEPRALEVLEQYVDGGGVLVCWTSSLSSVGHHQLIADQVLLNTEQESYLQARHLIELGHKNIGFLAHGGVDLMNSRFLGFKRALKEADLLLREEWAWGESGYEDAGIRHAERFMALHERPTGVCIVNDNSAAAFVHAVMRVGLQVPRDVSVIGCDDTAAARAAFVPLTTMRRPIAELSHTVVEILCNRLDGSLQGPPVMREVNSELIVRSSTATPRFN